MMPFLELRLSTTTHWRTCRMADDPLREVDVLVALQDVRRGWRSSWASALPSSLREIAAGIPPLRLARAHLLGLGFPGARGAMAALGVLGVLCLSPIPEEFRAPVDASPAPLVPSRHPHPPVPPCLVHPAGSSAQHPALPIVTKARCLLHHDVRVGVQDGRVFMGKLHCLDKQKNLILYDTVEFRSFPGRAAVDVEATPAAEERSLGLVLIPARCRTSCYVKCSFDEKMEFLNISS